MKGIQGFLSDEGEIFGPGIDLVISLTAVLLIITVLGADFYQKNQDSLEAQVIALKTDYKKLQEEYDRLKNIYDDLFERKRILELQVSELVTEVEEYEGGNFKIASDYFYAGLFRKKPVTELKRRRETLRLVKRIVGEYEAIQAEFPYIFIIGHANKIDLSPEDKARSTYRTRGEANWLFAGRRAAVIGEMIKEELPEETWEKIVVVSAGEYDLRYPARKYSQTNAWVEIVFGKEWKPPSRTYR